MIRRTRLAASPRLERLDDRCVLATLTPSLLNSAYGLNTVSYLNGTVKGSGEGQTIAIVEAYHDPTILSDLTSFDQQYNLPGLAQSSSPATNSPTSTALGSFTQYGVAGTKVDSGWNQEEALDVEWAHAVAPGANIIVVEAASTNLTDLLAAVNFARTIPSVSVVSMSWGGSEFSGETGDDNVFTTPAGHTGITFIAASGDSGAGVEWPASSPNVVGVGGTSLVVDTSGVRASETYWSDSGGGVSRYESEPGYQASVQSTGRRTVPDVAAVADPDTGVLIVSAGQQYQLGGTSLGSPIWAGLVAIADQGLAIAGKPSLDGPTQTLPLLYAAPAGSFNDVTTGSGTRANLGYDTSTGLGTPNAQVLVPDLVTTTATTTGGGTTTTGSGTTPVTPTPPAPPTPTQPPHRHQPPHGRWYGGSRSHGRGLGQSSTWGRQYWS